MINIFTSALLSDLPSWKQSSSVSLQIAKPVSYLTIISRALMASESIAHEAEGRMGY